MLRALTVAAAEPVSVEEAKLRLRLDSNVLDADVGRMITAAREIVERMTGFALAEVSYEWTPVGERVSPLPIAPGQVTSEAGSYPILFDSKPGIAPESLKSAILLLVGDMLANTEANTDKPLSENPALQTLIFPYRRVMP